LFSAAAILMGQLSTTALAAHQIALQVTAILFMAPFGVSMAATVRVGHAVGRRDPQGVRRAGMMAMLIGIVFAAVCTIAVMLARYGIARLFLGQGLSNADATIALAAELLLIGGTFFVTDALQTIAAGSLRGLNDTSVPLLFAAISYWLVGFCIAYLLAFHSGAGPLGVWLGLSAGTLVYATLLVARFRLLASRPLPGVR
jgi:MATE family, multidrug efflux pump